MNIVNETAFQTKCDILAWFDLNLVGTGSNIADKIYVKKGIGFVCAQLYLTDELPNPSERVVGHIDDAFELLVGILGLSGEVFDDLDDFIEATQHMDVVAEA